MSMQVELGVSMGLGENGKMAFAHKKHDVKKGSSKKSNLIAAEYSIGAMTAYLGYAQHKTKNNEATARGKIALAKNTVYQDGGPTGTFTQQGEPTPMTSTMLRRHISNSCSQSCYKIYSERNRKDALCGHSRKRWRYWGVLSITGQKQKIER